VRRFGRSQLKGAASFFRSVVSARFPFPSSAVVGEAGAREEPAHEPGQALESAWEQIGLDLSAF
jgi:hypothetical protein